MSLYHEAADILNTVQNGNGSLKSIVFSTKKWKNNTKSLYALTKESAKWSEFLSEVIEKSGVLGVEKNLSPILALLLTHDLLCSKKGIALPQTHGLHTAVDRHKVRLAAESRKATVRRGFPSFEALQEHINSEIANGEDSGARHPRWIRVNTLKSTLDHELNACFTNYTEVSSLKDITHAAPGQRLYHVDKHIPNLIAMTGPDNPTTFKSYKQGKLIIQEKASCFPAYLLNARSSEGHVIDACAAPGNKTTHLAALVKEHDVSSRKVFACEKDPERSKTLEKMVKLAGADKIVTVKPRQDFLKLDPHAKEFANVTSLLLDPSCSGSGIVGRDESTITLHLPSTDSPESGPRGKKRKRGGQQQPQPKPAPLADEDATTEETPDKDAEDFTKLKARLENLSSFQQRLLEHAMSFPAARRITYSTCSLHAEENEKVVVRALMSDVARQRGWQILKREDQVEGMKAWHKRGDGEAVKALLQGDTVLSRDVAAACIRCEKGGEDGTMGFFVAGFVRGGTSPDSKGREAEGAADEGQLEDTEEWNGFSEDET